MRDNIYTVCEMIYAHDQAQFDRTNLKFFIVETYWTMDGYRTRIGQRFATEEEAVAALPK